MPYLKYDPEAADGGSFIWPDGKYPGMLESVTNKTSSTGNPMQELVWRVWNGSREQKVWDYLTEKAAFKIRDLAYALDKKDDFKAGKFDPADFQGVNLTIELKTQPAKGTYSEKNVIKGYHPDGQHDEAANLISDDPFADLPSAFDTK
jgi:hypothetical protein